MPDTVAALAIYFGMVGGQAQPLVGAFPGLHLSSLTGEIRIETARLPERRPALPAIPLNSEIFVLTGTAEVEANLPATLMLSAGDRVLLAPAPPDREGQRGIQVRALGKSALEVVAGSGRVVLDEGDSIALRSKPHAREPVVAVEVLSGPVDGAALGWTGVLQSDEIALFNAGPPRYGKLPLEAARMAVTRRAQGSVDVAWVRAPKTELARAENQGDPLEARETDLRLAPAALPARALMIHLPVGARIEPMPGGPSEAGVTEAVPIVPAVMVLLILLAAARWARGID